MKGLGIIMIFEVEEYIQTKGEMFDASKLTDDDLKNSSDNLENL